MRARARPPRWHGVPCAVCGELETLREDVMQPIRCAGCEDVAMSRAAPPFAMTDVCTCGCDYGSHDGRGPCGQCSTCKRFSPRSVGWDDVRRPASSPASRRAALYLRVSTEDQTTENQRPELERLAAARGFQIVRVFDEKASSAGHRGQFKAMLDEAHQGRFHVILVWALDRFGRSMIGNMLAVLDLDRIGVHTVSFREPWLDTGGPVRTLLIAIFSWVAEQEREQRVARTKAGMERARQRGIRLGRPRARFDIERARFMRNRGATLRRIADELRVPLPVIARALKQPKGES